MAELEAESLLFSKKVNRAPHLGFEPWTTTAGAMGQSHYAAAALPKEDVQFELLILHIQCAEQIKRWEKKQHMDSMHSHRIDTGLLIGFVANRLAQLICLGHDNFSL